MLILVAFPLGVSLYMTSEASGRPRLPCFCAATIVSLQRRAQHKACRVFSVTVKTLAVALYVALESGTGVLGFFPLGIVTSGNTRCSLLLPC